MPFVHGTRLGPYEIQGPVGAGGMGEVYRAVDHRLGRAVAVKILPAHRVTGDLAARFEDEARAIAALSHPNIVSVFDVGTFEGSPFLVTELLEGETLRKRLRRGALPLADALGIALEIAQALAFTHRAGIMHRDIKPENVFLVNGRTVKLLDFGLAKRSAREPAEVPTSATTPGTLLGTFGYMSPEQVQGQVVDGRSDLFALGVTLHEMLTGAAPFARDTPGETLAAALASPAPSVRQSDPSIPPAVDVLVRRLLDKDPRRRFQSAAEVVHELESVSGRPRHPRPRLEDGVSVAVLAFEDLTAHRDHGYICEGMAEEIIDALAGVAGMRVASRAAAFRAQSASRDVSAVAAALDVEFVAEGSVRALGGRLRITARVSDVPQGLVLWSRQFDADATTLFDVQDDIARAVVDALRSKVALPLISQLVKPGTTHPEAYTLYLKGRHHWSRRTAASLRAGIECFEQAIALDPGFARAYVGLADAYTMQAVYGFEPPLSGMPRAKAAALGALARERDLPQAYAALGSVRALFDWEWAAAERDFERAIALDDGDATLHQWYAMHCLAPEGRLVDALAALARAQAIDPLSLPVLSSIGVLLHFSDRLVDAEAALRQAIDLDPSFAVAHYFLGAVLVDQGRMDAAVQHLLRASELTSHGPEVRAALGYAHARGGDAAKARAELAALDEQSRARYVSPSYGAQITMGLGDRAATIERLLLAEQMRSADLAWIGVRPAFRPLAADDAFAGLLGRLGLGGR